MRSPTSPSPPLQQSQLSLSSIAQYVFLAGLAYVLAGAPLSSLINSSSSNSESYNVNGKAREGKVVDVRTLESLVIPETNLSCAEHRYKGVYVLSRDPLVIYIEGFLGEGEGKEVVDLSKPLFKPSTIWTSGRESLNPTIRLSEKAPLPRSETVKCIEDRARTFQGWRPNTFVEKLWTQRYGEGGHYTYHYDWSSATKHSGRVSSFMVYVDGQCEGGGTHFPRLERPRDKSWCRFIECDVQGAYGSLFAPTTATEGSGDAENETSTTKIPQDRAQEDLEKGVIFKPIPGNAVYWENIRSDGSGFAESWHAGLPVIKGEKIGLNIWSWMVDGYVPPLDQMQQEKTKQQDEIRKK
ncbi:hypothetical protein COCVIDRAFT_86384 [Bipolaris victoriae FI3]|uniref:Prolyl 4-hydroxylase alpha subunit domain-containing protein n=1 Tax=Bipolaris victoriae (strain FI3) TaxID=930091 RepID=W7F837_BIPV3|nr:hypothetical protein COCVIDRAFT_86384 [Bipolaris victoriae FI3]